MQKLITLLAGSLFWGGTSNGQYTRAEQDHFLFLGLKPAIQQAFKGTAVQERIVARVNRSQGTQLFIDSTVYKYNAPQRGISSSGDNLLFYTDFNEEPLSARIFYDTTIHFRNGVGTDQSYRIYDNDNNLVNTTSKGSGAQYLAAYAAPGQCSLITANQHNSSSNGYDLQYAIYRSPNSIGNSTMDSTYSFLLQSPLYLRLSAFNSSGKPEHFINKLWDVNTNNWIEKDRVNYTYNSNNQLVKVDYQYWTGQWTTSMVDSIAYPSGNSSYQSLKEYIYNSGTGTYDLTFEELCHINAAGLHDTVYSNYPANSTSTDFKTVITYTAFNHIEEYRVYYKTTTGEYASTPGYVAKFYYETHNTTSGIPTVNKTAWRLYPNPMNNMLTFETEHNNTQAVLELKDITGRTVLQADLFNKKQTLNISHLQPGIYLYHITDNGFTVKQGKIMKQCTD